MPISPEVVPIDQKVQERPEGFSESVNVAGVQATPINVKQVNDTNGKPLISTPATSSAKIQLPTDKTSLLAQAKGSVANAATWLAKFLLRMIAKFTLLVAHGKRISSSQGFALIVPPTRLRYQSSAAFEYLIYSSQVSKLATISPGRFYGFSY